jgi:outer membrane lipoprotein-sorting protein
MSEFDKQESELFRLLRQSTFDDRPSEQHCESLHEQALQAYSQAARQKQQMQAHLNESPFYKWREMMRRPMPRLITAAIVCLSITAPWLFFPAHQTTVSAFDKLASAIVDAKTAKFQVEMKIEGPKNGKEKKTIPPMEGQCYYRAPGLTRMEMSLPGMKTVVIHDDDTGRGMELFPDKKVGFLMTSKGRNADARPNNPFTQIKEQLTKSRDKSDKENLYQELGEKEIDGRRAVGFRSKSAVGEFTIWGDRTTQLPIRVELVTYGTPQVTMVMSKFEVNVELDESLFALTPPADYKMQTKEVDASEPTEKDFVVALKTCTAMSGGEFPNGFSNFDTSKFIEKHTTARLKKMGIDTRSKTPNPDAVKALDGEVTPILRGGRFAMALPESAEATYAGKGVKQGAKDKPIFWYKPNGSTKYRVVYADLTVKEADTAPVDPNAVRMIPKLDTPKP